MSANRKTDLVTIEAEARVPDGGGGYTHSWSAIGQIYAEAKLVRATEAETRGGLRDVRVVLMTVWASEALVLAISPRHRLAWAGASWNVREVRNLPGHRPEVEIVAEAGVTQ